MRLSHCCLFIILIVTLGCGDGRVHLPTAPVAGSVTYQGKPLSAGRITFVHPSGQGAGTDLAADGSYRLMAIQGKNRVTVSCFMSEHDNRPTARPSSPTAKSLIPIHYGNCDTSGLTLDVQLETNRFDVDLVP